MWRRPPGGRAKRGEGVWATTRGHNAHGSMGREGRTCGAGRLVATLNGVGLSAGGGLRAAGGD